MGPYAAFNPYQVWLMVVLISGISLAGYASLRIVGTRYGALLLGFLGGLVSSTATTLIYSRQSKINPAIQNLASAVIVIASLVVILRLLLVSYIVAFGKLNGLTMVLSSGFLAGITIAIYHWRQMRKATELFVPETTNPTELHTAFGFGLLYVVVLMGAAWMADIAGSKGLYTVALVSGLTDVDAITLSSLRLFNLKQLTEQQTIIAITLAYLSNLGFKFGMVFFLGGRFLAKRVALGFITIATAMIIALFAL
jgi:uncharacterized membrane protein (DUF4010 family)